MSFFLLEAKITEICCFCILGLQSQVGISVTNNIVAHFCNNWNYIAQPRELKFDIPPCDLAFVPHYLDSLNNYLTTKLPK